MTAFAFAASLVRPRFFLMIDSSAKEARLQAFREFLPGEWEKASSDAGFPLDEVAHWVSEQTPAEILDRGAMYFTPGQDPDPPHALSDEQYAEATAAEFRDRHRTEC